jgi:hypothetical protein
MGWVGGGGYIIVVNRVTANHSAAGVIIMSVGASNGKLHFKRLERQVFCYRRKPVQYLSCKIKRKKAKSSCTQTK